MGRCDMTKTIIKMPFRIAIVEETSTIGPDKLTGDMED